jgi:dihydrofolate reductase
VPLGVNTFVCLDGVMQGPGAPEEDPSNGFDRGGWVVTFADQLGGVVDDDWFAHADAILPRSHHLPAMNPYWSSVTDPDNPVAVALNGLPRYVVSTTLNPKTATWANTEVIAADVVDWVTELKQAPGRELQVHGSWQLAQTLHQTGLVDIYRLLVFPIVVGAGKRLFDDDSKPVSFEVVSQKPSGSLTALELRPAEYRVGTFLAEEGRDGGANG